MQQQQQSRMHTILQAITDPTNKRAATLTALVLLVGELLLSTLIVHRVPCTCL